MYILNTSFMVAHEVNDLWIEMMKNRVIPFIRSRGFGSPIFTKVISNDSGEHYTYSLQIPMEHLGRYEEYNNEVVEEYCSVAVPAFGEKVLYFSSLLKKIEL